LFALTGTTLPKELSKRTVSLPALDCFFDSQRCGGEQKVVWFQAQFYKAMGIDKPIRVVLEAI